MIVMRDSAKATNDWDDQAKAAALDLDIVRLLTETTGRLIVARNMTNVEKWQRHIEMICAQLGDYNDGEGVHYTNLAGFQSIALGMFNKDNPLRKRALLPLSITHGITHVVEGGFLWADENTHNGNQRCMNHVYKKKGIRSSVFFRFIIKGSSWSKFRQLAAVVRGKGKSEKECYRPHACYATTEDIDVDTDDILFQAFDKHGIIVGPIPVGDPGTSELLAEQHQHYDSMSQ